LSEPKIKFVENLFCGNAISLGWIREIHIDKKFEHHKHLSKIIAHERKHQIYYDKWVAEKSENKKAWILIKNNIWDFFSCWKLAFYFDKLSAIFWTITIGGFITATILLAVFRIYNPLSNFPNGVVTI
jgi:hypothetical protein